MESRLRVFILVNELLRGGAQRIIHDLVKNANSEKIEFTVVCLKSHANFHQPETLDSEILARGIKIISIEGGKRISFREARTLYSLLCSERPDVLHTYLSYAGVMGRLIGRAARVPAIVSTQCNLPIAYRAGMYWADRLTLPLADAWTGATESIEASYGGSVGYFTSDSWRKGRRHFAVVAGVDFRSFDARVTNANRNEIRSSLGYSDSDVVVLSIARLVSWKGHEDLIDAFSYLPQHMKLAIIGWGPLESELKARVSARGLDGRVKFLLARSDVPELLAAADLYAQAHGRTPDGKVWEGPNTSQMEACAAHVPSVSTAVPRIESLIEDGVTGLLADTNSPKSIADALLRLCADPIAAGVMADNARTRVVERYSVDTMARTYQQIYAAVS
jgi:glycosyltransferase involved in cell wall biosynthesis